MSKSDGQQQQQAMEHQAEMQLHENNSRAARHHPSPVEQARLLDKVVESELETDDLGLKNLRAKDFPLSNYDEDVDTIEFKWNQEILDLISKSRFPHPRSGLTGLSRAWATGDTSRREDTLDLDEFARDEAFKMGTFSRAKRGESGFQQETSGKMVQESRAIREDASSSNSSGGGILGRLPGR